MNDGVKILLERMQTHPEEFHGEHNRWSEVINKFEKFFNVSERALINGALTSIRREELTRVVMQELLHEPTPIEVDPKTYTINNVGSYTTTATSIADLLRQQLDEQYLKNVAQQERFK
jgi:hypothetical protein